MNKKLKTHSPTVVAGIIVVAAAVLAAVTWNNVRIDKVIVIAIQIFEH